MNSVALVGRLVRDVDVRANGDSNIARFTLAVDRKFKNKDGNYDADFISCVAFGKTAEFIGQYFTKGMKIGVTGRIQTGSYTNKDGQKVYTTDVFVEGAEFVEKKTTNGQADNAGFTPVDSGNGGFMDISDEINEELPFN